MPIDVMNPNTGEIRTRYSRSRTIALSLESAGLEAPECLRRAADCTLVSAGFDLPDSCDGLITWNDSERLLSAPEAPLRHLLLNNRFNLYLPVHISCLPEVDLIGLRPLFTDREPGQEQIDLRWRITADGLSRRGAAQLEAQRGAGWAVLLGALFAASGNPAGAIGRLVELWKSQPLPLLAALTLRNLVVLFWKTGRAAEGDQLLAAGLQQYPDYAELAYLMALRLATQSRAGEAVPFLQRATSIHRDTEQSDYVGSGGESSWRAHWLLAQLSGHNQAIRFQHLLAGLRQRPAFAASVTALLRESLPTEIVDWLQWDLRRLARRERIYLPAVLDFLARHHAWTAHDDLLGSLGLDEASRRGLDHPHPPAASTVSTSEAIRLDGPFLDGSPEAEVNQELAAHLEPLLDGRLEILRRGLFLGSQQGLLKHPVLGPLLDGHLEGSQPPQLLISHRWMPVFPDPGISRTVVMTAWEFSSLPLEWREQIEARVDEMWVPWEWNRSSLLRLGLEPERIRVLQPAVDCSVWTPDGDAAWPVAEAAVRFLFLGDFIQRTGVDVLLKAFQLAFRDGEAVSLLLQQEVTHCAHRPDSLLAELRTAVPAHPQIRLVNGSLTDLQKAALLRGADAVVLPYRSDGLGLPILRAMACGTPVITSDSGYIRELCPSGEALLVAGQRTEVPLAAPLSEPYTDSLTWFEPDVTGLALALRQVYTERTLHGRRLECAERARLHVEAAFSWKRRAHDFHAAVLDVLQRPRLPRSLAGTRT